MTLSLDDDPELLAMAVALDRRMGAPRPRPAPPGEPRVKPANDCAAEEAALIDAIKKTGNRPDWKPGAFATNRPTSKRWEIEPFRSWRAREECRAAQRVKPAETTGYLLKHWLSPGDVVVMTAAVRDLKSANPHLNIGVDTSAGDLWQNNPHITSLRADAPGVRVIKCEYPSIHHSNQSGKHFIEGFREDIARACGLKFDAGPLRGDLHLSEAEKQWPEFLPDSEPYWIVVAGGKTDFTAKWWHRYQDVVDRLAGKVRFVQVGEKSHWHKPLNGVIDLVGKTSIRQLLQLIYHSSGVVCPVTFAMHAAAAVPIKPGMAYPRPCVVIAGGREPATWERYPGHDFLDMIGKLPCCATGGCWKSRCQTVGDGDAKDKHGLCERPIQVREDLKIAECMTMVTPEMVATAVEKFGE